MEDANPSPAGGIRRPSSSLIPGNKAGSSDSSKKEGYPITFRHLGKGGYELTLYAGTQGAWKKWMDHIGEQQAILRKRGDFYNRSILSDNFFTTSNRVNCLAPFGKCSETRIGLYANASQMADANSFMELTVEFTFLIDDLIQPSQCGCWMLLVSHRLMFLKNINYCWCSLRNHFSPILCRLLTRTNQHLLSAPRRYRVTATFSRLAYAWADILFAASNPQHCQLLSKCLSLMMRCQRARSRMDLRCSRVAKTN